MTETTLAQPVWPLNGYAPGGYTCICCTCEKHFDGDKRATTCLECAITRLRDANKALTADKARLEDELDEANRPVWPEWADQIRKCLVGYGIDPGDEWDLPAQFEDWLTGAIEAETARVTAAEAKLAKVEAECERLLRSRDGYVRSSTARAVECDRLSAELAEARKERDGLALIVNARKKHVDAVAAYNARREVLKTVPLGCRNLDIEFRAFSDAQSDFIATAQTVADSFLASKEARDGTE